MLAALRARHPDVRARPEPEGSRYGSEADRRIEAPRITVDPGGHWGGGGSSPFCSVMENTSIWLVTGFQPMGQEVVSLQYEEP